MDIPTDPILGCQCVGGCKVNLEKGKCCPSCHKGRFAYRDGLIVLKPGRPIFECNSRYSVLIRFYGLFSNKCYSHFVPKTFVRQTLCYFHRVKILICDSLTFEVLLFLVEATPKHQELLKRNKKICFPHLF